MSKEATAHLKKPMIFHFPEGIDSEQRKSLKSHLDEAGITESYSVVVISGVPVNVSSTDKIYTASLGDDRHSRCVVDNRPEFPEDRTETKVSGYVICSLVIVGIAGLIIGFFVGFFA